MTSSMKLNTILVYITIVTPSVVLSLPGGCCPMCVMYKPSCSKGAKQNSAIPTATMYPPGIDYCEQEDAAGQAPGTMNNCLVNNMIEAVPAAAAAVAGPNQPQNTIGIRSDDYSLEWVQTLSGQPKEAMERKQVEKPTGINNGAKVDSFQTGGFWNQYG
ncbi:hypothetical protein RP20_CCG021524 [Aedes albopictus]|nr:hypothetical protein RP20_CCG021524 [Aedes albopictus]